MKKILILFLVFIFSISFVFACVNDAECADGEACDAQGSCVVYCTIGETECSDGIDNDADGLIDYPADLECRSPYDTDEEYNPDCADGLDNNGDGLIDYPFDPLCESPEDPLENILTWAAPEITFWDWLKDILTFWN